MVRRAFGTDFELTFFSGGGSEDAPPALSILSPLHVSAWCSCDVRVVSALWRLRYEEKIVNRHSRPGVPSKVMQIHIPIKKGHRGQLEAGEPKTPERKRTGGEAQTLRKQLRRKAVEEQDWLQYTAGTSAQEAAEEKLGRNNAWLLLPPDTTEELGGM